MLEKGFDCLRSGQLSEAQQVANQLLSVNPNHHGAINLAGLVALEQGNKPQTVNLLQRATKLQKKEPIYWCNSAPD